MRNSGYDEVMTEALLRKLRSYPDNTYRQFIKDIGKHVNVIQRLGGDHG